ncbi:MAG: ATP-dependent Clp protease adapter ClpS [Hyphomicrobiales bacterium]|nr:ATP-dependent Clp protease adapter ClpS [Hyphomicrobiales bacterium]MDE2017307.1 ATP-dependent Clp protease adapter ClpS [Hyphomicrobiales bacterium]
MTLAPGPSRAYIRRPSPRRGRRRRPSKRRGQSLRPSQNVRGTRAAREPARRGGDGPGAAVMARTKTKTRKPSMFRVLLLNDDYTPQEFVVDVLRGFFAKDPEEAYRIMLHVHHNGVGECGVYTYEVAETKVTQVMDHSRKHQHPLQCVMEKK